jgi:hypothetical protein
MVVKPPDMAAEVPDHMTKKQIQTELDQGAIILFKGMPPMT